MMNQDLMIAAAAAAATTKVVLEVDNNKYNQPKALESHLTKL